MHFFGVECMERLSLNRPVLGEAIAAALGLVPNCAVSVAGAKLYLAGVMTPGAMMASSFSGCGVGLLVLFRINRRFRENVAIVLLVYVLGAVFGYFSGLLF
jgi:hypothetical protein